MSRNFFEGIEKSIKKVGESVQEKWSQFKRLFESKKVELSKQVMDANSPDDLINAGKRIQAEGEKLREEQVAVQIQESEKTKLEGQKNDQIEQDHKEALAEDDLITSHEQALDMNDDFDQKKALEEADTAAKLEDLRGQLGLSNPEEATAQDLQGEQEIEGIYGMRNDELGVLLNSFGNVKVANMSRENRAKLLDSVDWSKTEFGNAPEDIKLRVAHGIMYDQAKNKLVERLSVGELSESELNLAVDHFSKAAKSYNIASSSMFPHSIFNNKKIVEAVSNTENSEVGAFNKRFAEDHYNKFSESAQK